MSPFCRTSSVMQNGKHLIVPISWRFWRSFLPWSSLQPSSSVSYPCWSPVSTLPAPPQTSTLTSFTSPCLWSTTTHRVNDTQYETPCTALVEHDYRNCIFILYSIQFRTQIRKHFVFNSRWKGSSASWCLQHMAQHPQRRPTSSMLYSQVLTRS